MFHYFIFENMKLMLVRPQFVCSSTNGFIPDRVSSSQKLLSILKTEVPHANVVLNYVSFCMFTQRMTLEVKNKYFKPKCDR